MQKIFFSVVAVTTVSLFVSCKKETVVPGITKTIQLPANGDAVINASNTFAFKFFKAAVKRDGITPNKLISPLSIYLALAMVYNGADNATRDSITNVLALTGLTINDLNNTCQALMEQLSGEDNKVQLSIANSLWYNKNAQPLSPFVNTTKSYYLAGCQPLDFGDAASVKVINDWISEHTGNKIQNVLQSISPDDLLYLVNAIYFNGAWKNGFDAKRTTTGNFQLQYGTKVSVPFMNQLITTKVYSDNSMQLIELPYGGGNSYSMYIAMPADQQQTVNEFAGSLNQTTLPHMIDQMDSAQVQLALPSWEYTYSVGDMKPILSDLGMGIAFSDAADFSKMFTIPSTISKAIHKAFIKVNEQGTIAAAVTVIGFSNTSISLPLKITVDHPFVYLIVEKQTGSVLFMGTVDNPALH